MHREVCLLVHEYVGLSWGMERKEGGRTSTRRGNDDGIVQ